MFPLVPTNFFMWEQPKPLRTNGLRAFVPTFPQFPHFFMLYARGRKIYFFYKGYCFSWEQWEHFQILGYQKGNSSTLKPPSSPSCSMQTHQEATFVPFIRFFLVVRLLPSRLVSSIPRCIAQERND